MTFSFNGNTPKNIFFNNQEVKKLIYNNDVVWQKGSFAEDYQKVEYIESTGTQYIDTGVIANQNTGFEIQFYSNDTFSTSGYGTIFGTRQASNNRQFYLTSYGTSSGGGQFRWASSTTNNIYMSKQQIMNISLHKGTLTRNDGSTISIGSSTASFTTNSSISIFALNENSQIIQYGKLRLYSFKLFDGDNLIRNYIPCYRKLDGEIGLYDLVNNVFYIKQGTGTFLKGPEIIELPNEYQRLNYIEGTGTQYIDTNLLYAVNDRIEVDVAPVVITQDRVVFGSYSSSGHVEFGILSSKFRCDINNNATTPIVENVRYYAVKDGATWTVDGNTITSSGSNNDTTYPIYLFGRCYNGTAQKMSNIKIYSYKHIRSGVIIAYLIPCYRKADNEVGMYNLITNTFMANSGTGTFTKGAEPVELPSEYQQVEYIDSSGTQWIDTGVVPNTNTLSQIMFLNKARTGNVIYGYYINNDKTDYRFFNHGGIAYLDFPSEEANTGYRITGTSGSIPSNTVLEIELGNAYIKNLKTGNIIVSGTTQEFIGQSTIRLNHHPTSSNISSNTWYYVKIYNNGTLIRHLVPCYRKSDDEVGMYDVVNDVFYTNQGTDAFTKGADVN